jgi:hypothetical protein
MDWPDPMQGTPFKELTVSRPNVCLVRLGAFTLVPDQPKVAGINKNLILSKYQEFCIKKRYSAQVYTVVKGKT